MKKLALISAAAGIVMLASGCTAASSDGKDSTSTQMQQQCSADSFQSFVGQKLTSEITENIRSKAGVVRILRPNDAATMEYNPTRVNVHLDKDDRIAMITCG